MWEDGWSCCEREWIFEVTSSLGVRWMLLQDWKRVAARTEVFDNGNEQIDMAK